MAEASEAGRRIGCPIAESGEERMQLTRRLGAFKTSMLQDAEAGRQLEIDGLLDAARAKSRQRPALQHPTWMRFTASSASTPPRILRLRRK